MEDVTQTRDDGESKQVQPQAYVLPPGYFDFYENEDEISLLRYINVLIRRRWWIFVICLVSVAAAFVFSKLQTPTYEASATFLVAENRSTQVMSGDEGVAFTLKNPVDYFKTIAGSSPILDRLLTQPFPNPKSGNSLTLPEIWELKAETDAVRQQLARKTLKEAIDVSYERNFPNILTLKVKAHSPQLAADLANRLIELLKEYDVNLKTANAQERMTFIQNQLGNTEKQLNDAEHRLEEFLKRNKRVQAEQVEIERQRLEREIDLQSDIYKTLKKELEIARIAEKEDASAISVIDRAEPPQTRSKPRTLLNVALAGVVGLMLAVGFAFVLEFIFSVKPDSEDSREFLRLVGDVRNDLRRMLLLRKKG